MQLNSALLAISLIASLATISSAASPPNLIVCIADDISCDDFGCYGSRCARTPHIDTLASKGMKFTQAFLTASSCSPSRSSIITGRYPHNLGPGAELHQPIAANIPWLPTLLREQGYYTAIVGKNHMTRENAKVGKETWDLIDPGITPENHGGESNWMQTVIQRPKDKPFFFWFASLDAHRDWEGDQEWDATKYGPKHLPEEMVVPRFLVDDAATRADLASYHNEVSRFDYYVGQVVKTLTAEGLLENTLLLILADNGRPFPRAKTRLHDSGMKTALIAHWPAGITTAGSTCASLVSSIDIAPTFLELAGVQSSQPTFQGLSLVPLFKDPTAQTRQHAFSEHNWHDYEAHGRAVRSHDWLYVRNARPQFAWQGPADSVRSASHQALRKQRDAGRLTPAQADVFLVPRPLEELYNTANDPDQLHNLAADPQHAATRQKLAALLDEWIKETADAAPEGLTPDTFDRETGAVLRKGKNRPDRGVYPGQPHDAAIVNASGPR